MRQKGKMGERGGAEKEKRESRDELIANTKPCEEIWHACVCVSYDFLLHGYPDVRQLDKTFHRKINAINLNGITACQPIHSLS